LKIGLVLGVCIILGWSVQQSRLRARLLREDPDAVLNDAALSARAIRLGDVVFAQHCAACHGSGGRGDAARGVPNLADQDWLYGSGKVSDILRVVSYGIRAHDPRGWNLAVMPLMGALCPIQPNRAFRR